MTYRELVYMCLDEIKLSSDDSYITEDHILFLISKYRAFLLKQKYEKTNMPVAQSNYQLIHPNPYSSEVPDIMTIAKPVVWLEGGPEDQYYTYVPYHRFRFVGHNKFLAKIQYCTINPENKLVIGSYKERSNTDMNFYAVFEDIVEASLFGKDESTEILDEVCPIEADLIAGVQELVVKDILGIAYRPQDKANNSSDDLGSVGLAAGNPRNNK